MIVDDFTGAVVFMFDPIFGSFWILVEIFHEILGLILRNTVVTDEIVDLELTFIVDN